MNICKSENKENNNLDSNYPLCMSKKDGLFNYSRSIIVRTSNDDQKAKF